MRGDKRRLFPAILLFLVHCSDGKAPSDPPPVDAGRDVPQPKYTIEQLKDPETCKDCHQKHYDDWSGSMHAYASDDPLFLAMNDRGQKEANIGNFCVNCHAPMAVAAAGTQTVDTASLKALPKTERGVTCYFCHNIKEVTDTHNNPLRLANDNVMRGRYTDAVPNEAHASAYSELLDGTHLESATACGSCHDIVNDRQAHIERTFAEWKETVFSSPMIGTTCAQCHVGQQPKDLIADGPKVQGSGVFLRNPHDHKMAAVDTAITDFPQLEAQKKAVATALNNELMTALCVANLGSEALISVLADNVGAGHRWPSGSAQDRQLWFEVTAYSGGTQIYQSGAVAAGTDPKEAPDEDMWLIRDCMFDKDGQETHLFWDAASYDFNSLPGQLTLNQQDPNFYLSHVAHRYPTSGSTKKISPPPDRITLKVWLQAFPYSVYDEFIPELKGLGYNDAQIAAMRAKLAPVQVSAQSDIAKRGMDLEWTLDAVADKEHGGQEFRNGLVPGLPPGAWVQCVTGTAMNAGVQNVIAPAHKTCKP